MRQRNVKNKKDILNNCKNILEKTDLKGKWHIEFGNSNPIHLEIGTGKCKFIIEKARRYKDINFIGIERSDSVLALGIKDLEENLPNLRLINYDASKIEDLFDKEISTMYLNFSDPWPKKRHAKRRLTSKEFLTKYENIFKEEKIIVQKTDNQGLFESSITSLTNNGYIIEDISLDLHKLKNNDNINTEYEDKFVKKGCKIYMLKALKK